MQRSATTDACWTSFSDLQEGRRRGNGAELQQETARKAKGLWIRFQSRRCWAKGEPKGPVNPEISRAWILAWGSGSLGHR
jgi:hypothetical protein